MAIHTSEQFIVDTNQPLDARYWVKTSFDLEQIEPYEGMQVVLLEDNSYKMYLNGAWTDMGHIDEMRNNISDLQADVAGMRYDITVANTNAHNAYNKANEAAQAAKDAYTNAVHYADNLLSQSNAMVFKGVIGAEVGYPTISNILSNADWSAGWTWKAATPISYPRIGGKPLEIGDLLVAIKDYDAQASMDNLDDYFSVIQSNLDGAVIGPTSALADRIAVYNGTSGKLIKDGGSSISDINANIKKVRDYADEIYSVTNDAYNKANQAAIMAQDSHRLSFYVANDASTNVKVTPSNASEPTITFAANNAQDVLRADLNTSTKVINFSTTYSNSMPLPKTVGKLPKGTNISNMTVGELLDNILYPLDPPTISMSPTGNQYIVRGSSTTPQLTVTITRGDSNIKWAALQYSNSVNATQISYDNSGAKAQTFKVSPPTPVTTNTTFKSYVEDIVTFNATSGTRSLTFVDPVYYGVIGGTSLTGDQIKGMTQYLAAPSAGFSFTAKTTEANRHFALAVPMNFKTSIVIKDHNLYDITADFAVTNDIVVTTTGTTQVNYRTYIFTKAPGANYEEKLTISY